VVTQIARIGFGGDWPMADVKSFKDLEVWRVSLDLAEACYRATRRFPVEEMYGLTSQIRRAAAAIPANIAEGYGRETTPAFIQFLRIAQGSVKELETHLILAHRVEVLQIEDSQSLQAECDRVSRMLRNLIRALEIKSRS
jgi:four helix bundle protein